MRITREFVAHTLTGDINCAKRNAQRKAPARGRKRAKKKSRPRNGPRKKAGMGPVARMLADPCNAELRSGSFTTSEGYLARVRSTFVDNSDGGRSGYILWVPMYHNSGAADPDSLFAKEFNVMGWSASNSGSNPINNALGDGLSYGFPEDFNAAKELGTAFASADPASFLVGSKNAIVADARLISACIKMTYTGRMDAAAGEVCRVSVPLDVILGNMEEKIPAASVDELFRMATKRSRLGVDTLETIHRPETELTGLFHGASDVCLGGGGAPGTDATITGPSAKLRQPKVFGFAWRSLPTPSGDSSNLTFELTKNLEWRPSSRSGFVAAVPKSTGKDRGIQKAVAMLDANIPGWADRVYDSATSVASTIAQLALTGAGNYARLHFDL
jgi:hypothetical protein